MKVQDILDTVFKCDCGCKSELAIGDFGDGQFTFSVMEKPSRKWNEVIISKENSKKIIKLLRNSK